MNQNTLFAAWLLLIIANLCFAEYFARRGDFRQWCEGNLSFSNYLRRRQIPALLEVSLWVMALFFISSSYQKCIPAQTWLVFSWPFLYRLWRLLGEFKEALNVPAPKRRKIASFACLLELGVVTLWIALPLGHFQGLGIVGIQLALLLLALGSYLLFQQEEAQVSPGSLRVNPAFAVSLFIPLLPWSSSPLLAMSLLSSGSALGAIALGIVLLWLISLFRQMTQQNYSLSPKHAKLLLLVYSLSLAGIFYWGAQSQGATHTLCKGDELALES